VTHVRLDLVNQKPNTFLSLPSLKHESLCFLSGSKNHFHNLRKIISLFHSGSWPQLEEDYCFASSFVPFSHFEGVIFCLVKKKVWLLFIYLCGGHKQVVEFFNL
jgi:hypothetical protein